MNAHKVDRLDLFLIIQRLNDFEVFLKSPQVIRPVNLLICGIRKLFELSVT